MATKKGKQTPAHSWDVKSAGSHNPFHHVPFAQADLSGYKAGGGGAKIFTEIDTAYRDNLIDSLVSARQAVAISTNRYPNALTCLVFKLRSEAIAMSHRPITLVDEAGVIPAGHAELDEMIVGEIPSSNLLDHIIRTRNTKKIQANLSSILRIEPWSRARRSPEGAHALRERGTALIRMFRYFSDDATTNNFNSVREALHGVGAKFEEISQRRSLPLLHLTDVDALNDESLDLVLDHPGIRLVLAEPMYFAPAQAPNNVELPLNFSFPPPPLGLPVVGVFDSGCDPSDMLAPWIADREIFILPPDTDFVHGTAVCSLVTGSRVLNDGHDWFPAVGCKVHDVAALETGGSSFSHLEFRLRSALESCPDVRVWDLSLGAPKPCGEQFSAFGQKLDELSDEHNVLFVVAAGNYLETPRRGWPDYAVLQDQVCEPADSIRALTVGAITHIAAEDTLVPEGAAAPYSRRGPGPVFTPKPDIVHLGGGVHQPWNAGGASTKVLFPGDQLGYGFGTSFAAPIVASMAAHAWQSLEGHQYLEPSPSMVKALMIHAAQLCSPDYSHIERRYLGAGLPLDVISILYDRDDSFTLIFEAQIIQGAYRWRKAPYPVPDCLMKEGKFVGEVIITAAYAPPLIPDAGSEYVRANVDISFGVLKGDNISGKVPMEKEPGADTMEKAQIQNGGKWAPVKVHRKSFPKGVKGDTWALQAECSLRAFEFILAEPIKVVIAVTLRSLDGDPTVHAKGIQALTTTNWIAHQLPVSVPIVVKT
ncbi:MAG: peptidase [Rhodocyclales bacterium]|nr:peptidase [Rhodocyclales bacterium]